LAGRLASAFQFLCRLVETLPFLHPQLHGSHPVYDAHFALRLGNSSVASLTYPTKSSLDRIEPALKPATIVVVVYEVLSGFCSPDWQPGASLLSGRGRIQRSLRLCESVETFDVLFGINELVAVAFATPVPRFNSADTGSVRI